MAGSQPKLQPAIVEIVSDDFPVSHATIMRVYYSVGNLIRTHESKGEFDE